MHLLCLCSAWWASWLWASVSPQLVTGRRPGSSSVGWGHLEIDHVEVLSNQDLQDLGVRTMEGGGGQQEGGRENEEEEGAQTGDETQLIFYET